MGSEICGEEVVATSNHYSHVLLGSLEPLCREMRWLIYRYSHRKEPRTQVSPILLARGNSYAKHGRGRWIARSFVRWGDFIVQHRSWTGRLCHEVGAYVRVRMAIRIRGVGHVLS